MKNVLFLLIGNIRYDGRVLKEISTLRKAGYKVSLILSDFDADDDISNYDFNIILLRRKYSTNPVRKLFSTLIYFFRVRNAIMKCSPDILHCNDLNTLMFAYALPSNIKIIYDAHELYLESRSGMTKLFWSFVEKINIRKVKCVIVPQIDRLYYLYFRYKLPLTKYVLIENFPIKVASLSKDFFEVKYGINVNNKQVVTYLGAITKEREIEPVIRAVQGMDDILFFIIGNGTDSYKRHLNNLITDLKLQEKVFMFPAIPNKEVLYAINSSDIGVCFYNEKHFNSYFCASNKLYEYLNLGVKVLTNNTAGVARVVKHGENGFCCDYINIREIRNGLKTLVSMKKFTPTSYFWNNQEERFLLIYQ